MAPDVQELVDDDIRREVEIVLSQIEECPAQDDIAVVILVPAYEGAVGCALRSSARSIAEAQVGRKKLDSAQAERAVVKKRGARCVAEETWRPSFNDHLPELLDRAILCVQQEIRVLAWKHREVRRLSRFGFLATISTPRTTIRGDRRLGRLRHPSDRRARRAANLEIGGSPEVLDALAVLVAVAARSALPAAKDGSVVSSTVD